MLRVCAALLWIGCAACSDHSGQPPPPDLAVSNPDGGPDMASSVGVATKCSPMGPAKVLSNLPGEHLFPRVAFTGSNFVVAWNNGVTSGGQTQNRIVAQLTDKTGAKLGPNIPLSANPISDFWAPSIQPLLNGTVIAWTRVSQVAGKTAYDIVIDTLDVTGQRLDTNGKPCDPANVDCGIIPVTSSGTAEYPYLERVMPDQHSAAPTQNQIGLAFIDTRNYPCPVQPCTTSGNDVFWKKIAANGMTILSEKQITKTSGYFGFPRVAFDGVHDGIVWKDDTSSSLTKYYFAMLDGTGQVQAGPTMVGQASGTFISAGPPDLLWDDSNYAMAIANGSDVTAAVVFQRFASNGVSALAPVGVTFGGAACTPAIAWDGHFYAVVWQTNCGQQGSNLAFELIDPQGIRYKPDGTSCATSVDADCGLMLLTSNATEVASFPDIAWAGGASFGVAWMELNRSNDDMGTVDGQVYFNRIDCVSP